MRSPVIEAQSMMRERSVTRVLICRVTDDAYLEPVPPDSLYEALRSGELPEGIRSVATSDAATLFAVDD
jgi:hypothetical protein